MLINIKYKDGNIEEKEFEEFLREFKTSTAEQKKYEKDCVRRIELFKKKIELAYQNLNRCVLTRDDFSEIFKIIYGVQFDEELIRNIKNYLLKTMRNKDFQKSLLHCYSDADLRIITTLLNEAKDIISMIGNLCTLCMLDDLGYKEIGILLTDIFIHKANIIDTYKKYDAAYKEIISTLNKLSKKVISKQPIEYSLVRELFDIFEEYRFSVAEFDLSDAFSDENINKYNSYVSKNNDAISSKIVKERKVIEKHYETREERIARYNEEKIVKNYEDAGNIELTEEEMECVGLYLNIIEDLTAEDIETFENRTTEYLTELLDDANPYPVHVIENLIEKVNKSDRIAGELKKGICKALKHL